MPLLNGGSGGLQAPELRTRIGGSVELQPHEWLKALQDGGSRGLQAPELQARKCAASGPRMAQGFALQRERGLQAPELRARNGGSVGLQPHE